MPVTSVLILGCGYTGSRVAARLMRRGLAVEAIRRDRLDVTQPGAFDRLARLTGEDSTVLHSIPTLPGGQDHLLLQALGGKPARVVYLSTTSVYGATYLVDERTPVQPRGPRERARVETELAIQEGPWQSLILRPAAIYGPGRGVHVSMARGRFTLVGDGSNFISRIHVDDLAAIVEAALLSSLTGAFPVADEHPCESREIAEFCSKLLDLPMPVCADVSEVPETRRTNRRVDGSAICRGLSVQLQYPSSRQGIPAALRADSGAICDAR